MIDTNRITTGVAANLVESATPPANPTPNVAEASRRGLRFLPEGSWTERVEHCH